jgi:hypothetical protein
MVATHCLPSGSLGTSEIPVCNVSTARSTIATPGGSKRGVALTFQGTWLHTVDAPPPVEDESSVLMFATLQAALVANGWVAVTPCKPSTCLPVIEGVALVNEVNADTSGKGLRMLTMYQHWFEHLLEWVGRTYPGWPVIVTGVSLGGWLAIRLAQSQPASILAYAAEKPIAVWSALPFGVMPADTSGADLTTHSLDALTMPGFIGWSTTDTTVGFIVQQAMYNNAISAGRPVTSNPSSELHGMTAAASAAISSWLAATVNPLAPAVH